MQHKIELLFKRIQKKHFLLFLPSTHVSLFPILNPFLHKHTSMFFVLPLCETFLKWHSALTKQLLLSFLHSLTIPEIYITSASLGSYICVLYQLGSTRFLRSYIQIKLGSMLLICIGIKVKVGNDQEMAQSERNSHTKNRGEKN